MSGLPDKNKFIRSIHMLLADQGFLFSKKEFELYIEHRNIKKFELIKGSGSFWNSALIADQLIARLFEITYYDNNNQLMRVRFEMNTYSIPLKNANECRELVRLMENNEIFNKFMKTAPSAMSNGDDILQQIEKLGELYKTGVLTDEEFQSKKTELLKRL